MESSLPLSSKAGPKAASQNRVHPLGTASSTEGCLPDDLPQRQASLRPGAQEQGALASANPAGSLNKRHTNLTAEEVFRSLDTHLLSQPVSQIPQIPFTNKDTEAQRDHASHPTTQSKFGTCPQPSSPDPSVVFHPLRPLQVRSHHFVCSTWA